MRIKNILLIALLSTLPMASTFAQLVKIGAGGGITQVLAPDSYKNEVGDGGYGFTTEWNAGAVVKIDLPLLPITPRGFFLYHSLLGEGSSRSLETEENSQSIREIGGGVQYNFIQTPVGIDPYLAIDLSINNFGDFKTKYLGMGTETITNGFTRFGGNFGIGTEVSIIPMINLDLYLSYKMFNLVGKEDGEETVSAVTLDAFIIFNLL